MNKLELNAKMHNTHIKGLDGLRGLAALAVFASHYDQIIFVNKRAGYFDLGQLFANGNVAVSLFFTLSGYLLSLPYWDSLLYSAPHRNLKTYLLHRLARIMPAYYFCLTWLLFTDNHWQFAFSNPDILLHYLFLFNFADFSIFSINSVFWTIAVEMQFYLLLPLLFKLLQKIPKQAVMLILSIILIAYMLHYFVINTFDKNIYWPWDNQLTWIRVHGAVLNHSTLAHLPHFLCGVLAAGYARRIKNTGIAEGGYQVVFLATSFLLIIILSTPLYEVLSVPAGHYGFPVLSVLIALMILSIPHSALAVRFLDSLPLRKLGMISYGFYLYHLPVLQCLDRFAQNAGFDVVEHWALFAACSVILALITATLSYRLIERPVLIAVRAKSSASRDIKT